MAKSKKNQFNSVTTFSKTLAMILFIVFPILGFYFGLEYNKRTSTKSVESYTQNIDHQLTSVPGDWEFVSSSYCPIKFLVPPDKEPYREFVGKDTSDPLNKRYWQLRETNLADRGGNDSIFTSVSTVMYVADIEASDHIEGQVRIRCASSGQYALDNIAESYANGFGENLGVKVVDKRKIKMWGEDVVVAKIDYGMMGVSEVYFVIAGNYIVKIDKRSDSGRELVQKTTNQIFNNLQIIN